MTSSCLSFAAAAAIAALALSGCAVVTEAPAGAFALGPAHQVTLGRTWSDVGLLLGAPRNVKVLSVDGPWLDRLYLTQGLAPGEGLLRRVSREQRVPVFRADMSPREQVELVTDSLAQLDYVRVEAGALRPAQFAGARALRFDITAATKDGLEVAGAAQVAVVGGKLFVQLYVAPKEHYFGSLLAEVEAVFASGRPGRAVRQSSARS